MSKLSLTYESKLKGMINVGDPKDYTILYNVETDNKVSTISIKLSDRITNPTNIFMFSFEYKDLKEAVERIENNDNKGSKE